MINIFKKQKNQDKQIEKLRKFNLVMAVLHVLQGLAVLVLSNDSSRTITTSFLEFNKTTQSLEPASRALFDVRIGLLVALFFFLSAIAHLYVATTGYKKYKDGLKNKINQVRWYEYSLSASIMIVLIAMLSGIFDFGSLLALFALTAVMNLLGLVMEVQNKTTKKTSWLSFNLGSLAGIVPWIAIVVALISSETATDGDVPTFVYWIFVSLFIMFNSFAINMYLQYKRVGKWKDYLYGERMYIILSLVAKSLLAWQIFAGTLQPS